MSNPNLFAGMGGHQSARSMTEEWLTPPAIIDALGGADSFDMDPATPLVQPWPTARARYTREDDGLMRPWTGRIFLNPPYSAHEIGRWMLRLADHGRGVALIFARTETDTFFRAVWERATALLFLRGRLNFHYPDGRRAAANSGAPSVLCAYGARDADILAFAGIDGQFIPLRLPRIVALAALDVPWREIVAAAIAGTRGPVRLDDLYRALSTHPRTRRNPHWRAKVRQTLQQGPYRRVARGQWEVA